jgi:hypothetical protein
MRCAETASLASLISLPSALFSGCQPFRLYMRYCMDTAPNEKKEKRCKLEAKQRKPFIRESCVLCLVSFALMR